MSAFLYGGIVVNYKILVLIPMYITITVDYDENIPYTFTSNLLCIPGNKLMRITIFSLYISLICPLGSKINTLIGPISAIKVKKCPKFLALIRFQEKATVL